MLFNLNKVKLVIYGFFMPETHRLPFLIPAHTPNHAISMLFYWLRIVLSAVIARCFRVAIKPIS